MARRNPPLSFENMLAAAVASMEQQQSRTVKHSADDILDATLKEFESPQPPPSHQLPEMEHLESQLQQMIQQMSKSGPPQVNPEAMKIIAQLFAENSGKPGDSPQVNLQEMFSLKNRVKMVLRFVWAFASEKLTPTPHTIHMLLFAVLNFVTLYTVYALVW